VWEAFTFLDGGPGGNKVVNLKEIRDGVAKLKWKQFANNEDVVDVFRFLDADAEGSISVFEWGVMHQLWKDLALHIVEFIEFIERSMGEDLNDFWDEMDRDENGIIDIDEWFSVLVAVQYFGPGKVIYDFLARSSEEDYISRDGWLKLEHLQERREELKAIIARPGQAH